MSLDLKIKNIVLVGQFDPPLYDKFFFIKNSLLTESQIQPASFFQDTVHIVTEKMRVVILPQQIVFHSSPTEEDNAALFAFNFISKANLLGITGMGINFHYFLIDKMQSLSQLSRKKFFNENSELHKKFFDSEDAMAGTYLSKGIRNARLKLDIKPVTIETEINSKKTKEEAYSFVFNFHFTSSDITKNEEILVNLKDYSFYESASKEIVSLYA